MGETNNKAIEIIKNEKECVKRAVYCNRKCETCDLVREDFEIIESYDKAIHALTYNSKYKNAMEKYKQSFLSLRSATKRAMNEILRTANIEVVDDSYQLGVNYGLMLGFKILKGHIDNEVGNIGV